MTSARENAEMQMVNDHCPAEGSGRGAGSQHMEQVLWPPAGNKDGAKFCGGQAAAQVQAIVGDPTAQ